MVQAHVEDDQSWYGAVGDDSHDPGLVSGAIAGREQDQKTPAARHGFLRGSGPDQQPHQYPEIVPRDVDQIALVDVLPDPQPRPAHSTAVQDVSEGALDQLRSFAHRLLADLRAQPNAVVINRPARIRVPVPAREGPALRFGNPGRPRPPSRSFKTVRA